jgi:hypothetical protein
MKFTLSIAALSVLLCTAVQARDIEVGTVLVCDTQQQAERIGILLHGNQQNAASAISELNAEENSPTACGVVDAAYVRGIDLTTVRAEGETFQIAPVLVIGMLDQSVVRPVPQKVYFSVFRIDERRA